MNIEITIRIAENFHSINDRPRFQNLRKTSYACLFHSVGGFRSRWKIQKHPYTSDKMHVKVSLPRSILYSRARIEDTHNATCIIILEFNIKQLIID